MVFHLSEWPVYLNERFKLIEAVYENNVFTIEVA